MVSLTTHTATYQNNVNALKRNKKQEINSKIEELNLILNDENNEVEIEILEAELKSLTDEMLQEQSSFYKNSELLNNCNITKDFLRLESRKVGYNDVVRIIERDSNNEPLVTITDPSQVSPFQSIFNEQTVDNSPNSIDYFFTLDNAEEPLTELRTYQK